jgi:hypothetical protein
MFEQKAISLLVVRDNRNIASSILLIAKISTVKVEGGSVSSNDADVCKKSSFIMLYHSYLPIAETPSINKIERT